MSQHHKPYADDYVFSPYITLRNGRRLYAKERGKKAFCFPRNTADKDTRN